MLRKPFTPQIAVPIRSYTATVEQSPGEAQAGSMRQGEKEDGLISDGAAELATRCRG
jgi:hypothetical protein